MVTLGIVRNRKRAFTLRDLLFLIAIILVVFVVGCWSLAAIMKARHGPVMRASCTNNLKQVGLAFRQWELDHDDKFPMQVPVANGGTLELVESGIVYPHFMVMSNELNTPKILFCPQDRNHSIASSFTNVSDTNISYFVGVDADASGPAMFLAGDGNLATHGRRVQSGLASIWTNLPLAWIADRHTKSVFADSTVPPQWGNVVFADGSSRQLSDQQLRDALIKTGVATNRLAIP
jgi:hypothetical protein